jgi:hypothetical protein
MQKHGEREAYLVYPVILYDSLTDAQVLVENIGDAIVLAFRGTKYARDWLIDMEFGKVGIVDGPAHQFRLARQPSPVTGVTSSPAPAGEEPVRRSSAIKIHRGFLRAIESLLPKIVSWLDGPEAGSAPKPLLITGHSLGGALATLAAFFLHQRGYPIRAVYTFASPRVGNGGWRDVYNGKHPTSNIQHPTSNGLWNKTFRLAAAGDLVPLVPGLLDGYRHVGNEVFISPKSKVRSSANESQSGLTPAATSRKVSRETRETAGETPALPIIRINPNHIWEIFCDEVRTARALRRFNLDFILKFHSLEEDYLPLLAKVTSPQSAAHGQAGEAKMGTFNIQHAL